MTENRIPDGCPPRREDRASRASSHPELLSGDLAMIPRPCTSSASASDTSDTTATTWSVRTLGIFSILVAGLLLASGLFRTAGTPDDVDVEKQKFARTCSQWHLAASTAVSRLVHSTRDADLRQVNDSIFRMRRARRNCEAGWFELACQDYFAVAASTSVSGTTGQFFPCVRVADTAGGSN